MRRLLAAALLLPALLCPALLSPATAGGRVPLRRQGPPPAARLVDSFGNILVSDEKARLDNFTNELRSSPGARGVIAVYAARNKFPGRPVRRAQNYIVYLVESRGIDPSALSVVNGGMHDDTLFELWFVPPGAVPPVKPFDVSLLMTGERTALPFDRFTVWERGDPVDAEYYDLDARDNPSRLYDYLAEALRLDPSLRACLVGYTSRRRAPADARRIAERVKKGIAASHVLDVGRLVAVGGGRREFKMVEVWLVPPGAELPQPTPDAPRPKRARR